MARTRVRHLEILSGWKDIANHLGKGVRTIQRYERKLGLPVRRPAGKSKGAVIATKAEIDAWVTASPIRSTYRLAQSAQDQGARLKEFRIHVQELHRLRAEAGRLQEDLKQAFSLLQASFSALREQPVVVSSSKQQKPAEILPLDPTKKPTDLVH